MKFPNVLLKSNAEPSPDLTDTSGKVVHSLVDYVMQCL